MIPYNEIENKLKEISEENQKKLNTKLCPDTNKEILGIRIPNLRKLAKELAKEYELNELLYILKDKYF